MPNYKNGKIYSIRFYDNDKLIYIGSTIQPLAVRFGGHKKNINCSTYQYIQENYNGDFNHCYMELLENYECNDKNELNKKEGEYIRKFKTDDFILINKNIAGRTNKEYQQESEKYKEYKKQYREKNKDRRKKYKKRYDEKNEERNQKYRAQYKEKNKDRIREYNEYYRQILKTI